MSIAQGATTPTKVGCVGSPVFLDFRLVTAGPSCYCQTPTPFIAFSSPLLSDLIPTKSHFDTVTKSSDRRDTGPNSFQFPLQLHPNPLLQLRPFFTLGEARRRRDLAVRHVLAVGFGACAGAISERARTDFGGAGQHLYDDADGEVVVVFAAELALAEAGEKGRNVSG